MRSNEFGGGEVVLFQAEDGKTRLEVQLDRETVWLNQDQMTVLFDRDQSVISRHVRSVFKEGELDEKSNMQKMHIANSDRPVTFYNLGVIISIGYRVKSQRGTQFRQWATRVLREHIVRGYTVNEQRLREEQAKFLEMRQTVELLTRTLTNQELVTETGRDVLRVIGAYAYALATLDRYDHGTLAIEATTRETLRAIDYDQAIGIVRAMKGEFDGLFGIEKDQGFKSALGTIYQTLAATSCTRASRRRPPTCSTSSSRTTPSVTATSGSPPRCSSASSPATASSTAPTAPSAWPTTPWWR